MEDGVNEAQQQPHCDNPREESISRRVERENIDASSNGEFNLDSMIRDPGARPSKLSYPTECRDEIRRAYSKLGPYQLCKSKYPLTPSSPRGHMRSFQEAWFKNFWWLEYSEKKDATFCFPCYLFNKKPIGRVGSDRFTSQGFNKWKKVNCGKDCAFIIHEGKTLASAHNFSLRCYEDLKNHLCNIENVIEKQTNQEIMEKRLRLKASIDATKWLTFQACAFRGHDERPNSSNQGNFLELVKLIASYNKNVEDVVLGNAPKHAKYTSPDIQKDILRIFATIVQVAIRDEIGKAKFCLIVDESQDESKKEQMAIVLRFVDQKDVQNLRGQGYDGASNMRGEWHGLQALLLKECPYAYYVHCFAHQLQLALLAASKDVSEVHTFFKNLNFIVNVISCSSKRNDQLQDAQIKEISRLSEIGELESGKGLNQISLQRPGDTRWSSHFRSICSLMKLFGPSIILLNEIAIEGSTSSQRGDAKYALTHVLSFDFVISMHVVKEILEITNKLCHALQLKFQDIVNALDLVSTTKILIQKTRDEGWKSLFDEVHSFCESYCWKSLFDEVHSFCESYCIPVPGMKATYKDVVWSRRKKDDVTVEHHYRVDVFIAVDCKN